MKFPVTPVLAAAIAALGLTTVVPAFAGDSLMQDAWASTYDSFAPVATQPTPNRIAVSKFSTAKDTLRATIRNADGSTSVVWVNPNDLKLAPRN